MKKLVLLSFVSLFVFLVSSCDKQELLNDNAKSTSNISNQRIGGYMPGEVFYEDGWVGWIDPDLSSDPVPEPEKEPAKWKGSIVHEGETTYISCPTSGDNCGRLYTVDEGGVTFVGLYIEDN